MIDWRGVLPDAWADAKATGRRVRQRFGPALEHLNKWAPAYALGFSAIDIAVSENKTAAVVGNVSGFGAFLGARKLLPRRFQLASSFASWTGYGIGRNIGNWLAGTEEEESSKPGRVAGAIVDKAATTIAGDDDAYNTVEAFQHSGLAGAQRRGYGFGSGWRGLFAADPSPDISPSYNMARDVYAHQLARASSIGASEKELYKRMTQPAFLGDYIETTAKAGTALHMLEGQNLPVGAEGEQFLYDPVHQVAGHADVVLPGNIPMDVKSVSQKVFERVQRTGTPRKKDVSQVQFYMSALDADEGGIKYVSRANPDQSKQIFFDRDEGLIQANFAKLARVRARIARETAAGFLNPENLPKAAALDTLLAYEEGAHPEFSDRELKKIFREQMARGAALKGVQFRSGKGSEDFNIVEGLGHSGIAWQIRQGMTDFGSGYKGPNYKGPATWANKDFDLPVTMDGVAGKQDGKTWVWVTDGDGNRTAVPSEEIKLPKASKVVPAATAVKTGYMGPTGSEKLAKVGFTTMDLETTGMLYDEMASESAAFPPKARQVGIVEIGAQNVRGQATGKIWDTLVSPGKIPIDQKAAEVHGITMDRIREAASRGKALDNTAAVAMLKQKSGASVLVGHNILGFDLPVLEQAAERGGLPGNQLAVLDTMRLSQAVLSKKGGYYSTSLEAMAEIGMTSLKSAHRVAGDVTATSHLLQNLIKESGAQTWEELVKFAPHAVDKKTRDQFLGSIKGDVTPQLTAEQRVARSQHAVQIIEQQRSGLLAKYGGSVEKLKEKYSYSESVVEDRLSKHRATIASKGMQTKFVSPTQMSWKEIAPSLDEYLTTGTRETVPLSARIKGLSDKIPRNWKIAAGIAGAVALTGLLWSGHDDEYNTIEGFEHRGMASATRRQYGFGSGWIGQTLFKYRMGRAASKYGKLISRTLKSAGVDMAGVSMSTTKTVRDGQAVMSINAMRDGESLAGVLRRFSARGGEKQVEVVTTHIAESLRGKGIGRAISQGEFKNFYRLGFGKGTLFTSPLTSPKTARWWSQALGPVAPGEMWAGNTSEFNRRLVNKEFSTSVFEAIGGASGKTILPSRWALLNRIRGISRIPSNVQANTIEGLHGGSKGMGKAMGKDYDFGSPWSGMHRILASQIGRKGATKLLKSGSAEEILSVAEKWYSGIGGVYKRGPLAGAKTRLRSERFHSSVFLKKTGTASEEAIVKIHEFLEVDANITRAFRKMGGRGKLSSEFYALKTNKERLKLLQEAFPQYASKESKASFLDDFNKILSEPSSVGSHRNIGPVFGDLKFATRLGTEALAGRLAFRELEAMRIHSHVGKQLAKKEGISDQVLQLDRYHTAMTKEIIPKFEKRLRQGRFRMAASNAKGVGLKANNQRINHNRSFND